MAASRDRRHLRRIGYGFALGAGLAFAPFAVAAATAEPVAQPPAAEASAQQHVKPVTYSQKVAAKPVVAPAAGKPVAAKPVAAKPVSAKPVAAKPVAGRAGAPRATPVAPRGQAPRAQSADRRPVVVIGASVSTGKAVSTAAAYPRQVHSISGRPVYVSAKVGAGYADGSMARLTRAANLPARNPSLVVLQAGTNDVGAKPTAVAGQVRQVVSTVRRQAPGAKIAVVTVFPSIHNGAPAHAVDNAIVSAARSVDPTVAVISPLDEGWRYRASGDGHPGAAAHERIAERVSALA